jgi:hypothetical protein
MAAIKKRVIKSLEKLTDDLKDLLKDQYPNGYEGSITRITNSKKEPIFVFPLETSDAIYLVKVPATKNSEGEYDVDVKPEEDIEPSRGADDDFPATDDAFSSTGAAADDDYDEDGTRKSREASYDPDFDT